eukprot:m.19785 g.19785  ORF g.19785 m.19785 type:complete len:308 (+) comp10957_c0_seq1:174-1097(+)
MGRSQLSSKRAKLQQRHAQHRYTESLRRTRMKAALAEVRQLLSLKRNEEQANVLEAAVKVLRSNFAQQQTEPNGTSEQTDASSAASSLHEDVVSLASSSDESADGAHWPQYQEQPAAVDYHLTSEASLEPQEAEYTLPMAEELPSTMEAALSATLPVAPPTEMSLQLLEPAQLDFLIPTLYSRHVDDSVSMLLLDRHNAVVDCNGTFLQQAGLVDTTQLTDCVRVTSVFGDSASTDFVLSCLSRLRKCGMGSTVIVVSINLAGRQLGWYQVTLTHLPGAKQSILVSYDTSSQLPSSLHPHVVLDASV